MIFAAKAGGCIFRNGEGEESLGECTGYASVLNFFPRSSEVERARLLPHWSADSNMSATVVRRHVLACVKLVFSVRFALASLVIAQCSKGRKIR